MKARMVKKMNIVTSVWLDEVCGGDMIGTLYMRRESRFLQMVVFPGVRNWSRGDGCGSVGHL